MPPESPWMTDGMVGVAGTPGSGTRMMWEVVFFGFRLPAMHLSLPGYPDRTDGPGIDVTRPVWWTKDEVAGDKDVRWVVITREPRLEPYAARSAVRRGMVASTAEYKRLVERAAAVLDGLDAFRVTYEDFVADYQKHVDALAEYLGVPTYAVSGIAKDRNT